MKDSIRTKLESVSERHEELGALLGSPDVISDQTRFRDYSKEYAQIEPIVSCFQAYKAAEEALESAKELMQEDDPEMRDLAQEELQDSQQQIDDLEGQLQILLLPKDPDDKRNIYLEIRAGTGGDEAAIFVGDLYRMYSRYAEQQKWKMEIVTSNPAEHGGYKEIICRVLGTNVYGSLKFESGAHRVQRVPETESQGRIHTSACTVAILPEVESIDEIKVNTEDLRIDTFRASGAGGQHVNKTDSAIRITHLPTNTVVECQDERSQHKNKAKALALLQARLLAAEQSKQQKEEADTRKNLVGSGDRSERIRTYNYPQGRITDHRINLTLYKLAEIIEGDLDQVVQALVREHQMDQLAEIGLSDPA